MNYYNEWDKTAGQWLRNLAAANHIPSGIVDGRSITEVKGPDINGHGQAHFFAGIGGWPLALRLAGWPEDREVWTGSCPCQPFSASGKRKGVTDERHLWPEFNRLIAECRPTVVFGEQVASQDGRLWLAGVRSDMEALGYRFGAADLCAAGVSAPHIRQRIFWVADSIGAHEFKREKGERQVEPTRRGWEQFQKFESPDKKARRVEQGASTLAYGVPFPLESVRAYGNAIVPAVAVEFIKSYLEAA